MSEIRVRTVATKDDLKAFITLPYDVYANDKYWVPPLESDVAETLSAEKNPFFLHGERELFLVEQDGKFLGRIAAIIDRNYVAHHKENIGFFGFFESINNYEVAAALFDAARNWLRGKGMTKLRGPANPSINDEAGFLLEGFDSAPVIKMPYNPIQYLEFSERYGMAKAKDLFAWYIRADQKIPAKLVRVVEAIRSRPGLTIHPVNMRDLGGELKKIKEIYNDAWSQNWDFSPFTDAEIDDMARKMKQLIVPELIPIIEINGEPAGMSIALPDYNQVLKRMHGKLNIATFLWYSRKIDAARLWALGVKCKFHSLGLGALLYYDTFQAALKKGYKWGELSWILEDNVDIIRPILLWDVKLYKKYRVFEMAV